MTAYLLVTGSIFLFFGLGALFKPIETIAFPYSLNADSVDAKNYLRSGAGGSVHRCGIHSAARVLRPAIGGRAHGRLAVRTDGQPRSRREARHRSAYCSGRRGARFCTRSLLALAYRRMNYLPADEVYANNLGIGFSGLYILDAFHQ